MELLVVLIINILSTARLTYLFVDEDGPFQIFKKIREYFGLFVIIKETGNEEIKIINDSQSELYTLIQGILECKWCCSVWMAIVVYILSINVYMNIINIILALSMVSILIFNYIDKK